MKKFIKWSIRLLFTIFLFILIFNPRLLGIQKQLIPVTPLALWQEIKAIDISVFWKWFLIAMGIQACGFLCNIVRWNLLLKGQGIGLPFAHLLGSFLVGRFFSIFLPSTIGLDGYRLYDVARHTKKIVASATVILIEKLTGFIALTFLLFITLPLGLRFFKVNMIILAAILLLLGVFIVLSFLLLFNPRIIQILFAILPIPLRTKIQGKLNKIALAVTAYGGQGKLLAQALACGFLVHLCTTLMYFATAMSIKTVNIHILDILFASPIMIYGTVLGPSIGGEGIREGIFALLLGNMAGPAKAILFAHLGFWVGGILSLAGGLIFMIRPAEYRPRVEEMKEVLTASQQRAGAEFLPPEEIQRIRENAGVSITSGIVMGLWAGALVGLLESVVIIFSFPGLSERTILYYGPLLYGAIGGLLGCGAGIVVSLYLLFRHRDVGRSLWAAMFCAMFVPLTFIIARFRISRDVLNEQPLSLAQNALILILFAVLAGALFLLLKQSARLRAVKFLATGFGVSLFWAFFICSAVVYCTFARADKPGLATAPSPPVSQEPGPPVILIVIDALRAKQLSCYGYSQKTSPRIDRFASDGILYTNHFAQSSWTKPQSATILTSLYPSTHNTYLKPHVLPDAVDTVAEILRNKGYRTGAIVTNINLAPQFNFQQGFDYYRYLEPDYFFFANESSSRLSLYNVLRLIRERFLSKKKYVNNFYQDASEVTARASSWIAQNKDVPFFLFLHYMEPHDPYFAHPYSGEAVARVTTPNPPPEKAESMRNLYNGEILFCDEKIGELLNVLKQHGIYDECLIVLTSDHGEEFYDHGGWWHGTTLFDEVIHIPLIIKLPGNRQKGTMNQSMVRSLDITPTIIHVAGGTISQNMQGRSLLQPLINGQEQLIFSEEDHEHNIIKSLRTERWKLILTKDGSPRKQPPVQLFDIQNDPLEKIDLSAQHPEIVTTLRKQIEDISRDALSRAYTGQQKEIDHSTKERLKALGYVQ